MLHDKEYKEFDVDVEVQIPVTGKYKDTEHVRFKTEPAVTAASMIFEGSYEQFSEVYSAIALWVDENGYEFCGAMMDPYHVSPHETQNPMEWVTEVCCPIRRRHEDQPVDASYAKLQRWSRKWRTRNHHTCCDRAELGFIAGEYRKYDEFMKSILFMLMRVSETG